MLITFQNLNFWHKRIFEQLILTMKCLQDKNKKIELLTFDFPQSRWKVEPFKKSCKFIFVMSFLIDWFKLPLYLNLIAF